MAVVFLACAYSMRALMGFLWRAAKEALFNSGRDAGSVLAAYEVVSFLLFGIAGSDWKLWFEVLGESNTEVCTDGTLTEAACHGETVTSGVCISEVWTGWERSSSAGVGGGLNTELVTVLALCREVLLL